jgi:hypothetical protein
MGKESQAPFAWAIAVGLSNLTLRQPVAKGRFDLQVLARNLGHEHAPAGGRVE